MAQSRRFANCSQCQLLRPWRTHHAPPKPLFASNRTRTIVATVLRRRPVIPHSSRPWFENKDRKRSDRDDGRKVRSTRSLARARAFRILSCSSTRQIKCFQSDMTSVLNRPSQELRRNRAAESNFCGAVRTSSQEVLSQKPATVGEFRWVLTAERSQPQRALAEGEELGSNGL
jgi:hypothetical protein